MRIEVAQNEIAKKYGYKSWDGLENGMLTHISDLTLIKNRLQEAINLCWEVNKCTKCNGGLWLYDEVGNQTEYCGCYYLL